MTSKDLDRALESLSGAGGLPRLPTAPPEGHTHVANSRLWELAAFDSASMSSAERQDWESAAECSACFNRLLDARRTFREAAETGAGTALPFARVWEAMRRRTREVVLEWLQAGLVVHAAASTAIRRRSAYRARDGAAEGSPQAWEIVEQFEGFQLTLHIEARQGRSRSWTLAARLTPPESLSAKLYCDATLIMEKLLDPAGETTFAGLDPAAYVLDLARPGMPPVATIRLASRISL